MLKTNAIEKSKIVLTISDFDKVKVDEIRNKNDNDDFNSKSLLSKTIETFENEIDEKIIKCLLI